MLPSLQLLGGPQLIVEGQQTVSQINRPLLLLSYLAMQETGVRREELLTLFWPEEREAKARQNLRALVYKCKQESWGALLEFGEERIRCLVSADVAEFQEAMANGDWQLAVSCYQGTFLERVKGDASAAFENWLQQMRDELHLAWRDAAVHVAEELGEKKQYGEAIHLLQQILAYDFLAEDVVQQCMRFQALAGHKAHALATFETFRKQLQEELEMEPLGASLQLAAAIRQDEIRQVDKEFGLGSTFIKTLTLPQALTPFVGRTLELLELANILAEPHNRLITLLGPGGMGKSRLALRLLEIEAKHFLDGVAFVSLAPLSSANDVPDALASALNVPLSGEKPVKEDIVAFLQDKTMLIVLDNFEHLLKGAGFVSELLEQAPGSKFICTSRVLLGIANEVVYDVVGLTIPHSQDENDVEGYDAAQFFIRSARRVRSDFAISAANQNALIQLCRYLEGMPLALELAASWLRLFTLRELIAELEKDIDLLEVSTSQVSERHQSMRRVFAQSWELLSAEEQAGLAALSVFRGGFTRQASSAVVGISSKILLALLNKSLLRTTASGRFSILEVIRQYATEKLDEEDRIRLSSKHAAYYLDMIALSIEAIRGASPKDILERLELELENLRNAWHWAIAEKRFESLTLALEPFDRFIVARSRIQEGIALVSKAIAALAEAKPDQHSLLANLYLRLSNYYLRSQQFEQAEKLTLRALDLLESLAEPERALEAFQSLANLANQKGSYEQAVAYEKRALAQAYALNNDRLIAKTLGRLAVFENHQGNYPNAQRHYEEAIVLFKQQNNLIGMTYNLTNLAGLMLDLGKLTEAQVMLQEALPLIRDMGDHSFLPAALLTVGECDFQLQNYHLARDRFLEGLRVAQHNQDHSLESTFVLFLGRISLINGDVMKARQQLYQGLKQAWDIQDMEAVMLALLAWAEWLLPDMPSEAASLLQIVVSYKNVPPRDRNNANRLLARLKVSAKATEADNATIQVWVSQLLARLEPGQSPAQLDPDLS